VGTECDSGRKIALQRRKKNAGGNNLGPSNILAQKGGRIRGKKKDKRNESNCVLKQERGEQGKRMENPKEGSR